MKDNINALRGHLFDVIERLKCSGDPDVDPKDTITIEVAAAIVDCAKVIVESTKTEVQAIAILAKAENPSRVQQSLSDSGCITHKLD